MDMDRGLSSGLGLSNPMERGIGDGPGGTIRNWGRRGCRGQSRSGRGVCSGWKKWRKSIDSWALAGGVQFIGMSDERTRTKMCNVDSGGQCEMTLELVDLSIRLKIAGAAVLADGVYTAQKRTRGGVAAENNGQQKTTKLVVLQTTGRGRSGV